MKIKNFLVFLLIMVPIIAIMAGGQTGSSPAASRPFISVYSPSNIYQFPPGENENNNRIVNFIKEKTGYDLNWMIAPSSNTREAMNMLMASGSPPDMIYTDQKNIFNDYTNQRLIHAVDDFVNDTKNIKTIVPAEAWKAVESNGRRYSVPVPRNIMAGNGLIVRKDYLDRLGNPKLETLDDFVNVFQMAFDRRIGGNETIPYVMWGGIAEWDIFSCAFGLGVEYDDFGKGILESTWTSENARAYLRFMSDLFSRKLIDQELAVNTTGTIANEKMLNGRGLMLTSGWTNLLTLEQASVNSGRLYEVITPPKTPQGLPTYAVLGGPVRNYFMFPVQSRNTKAAIAFLDRCIEDDIRMTISYGWEGEHYVRTMRDGVEIIEPTELGDKPIEYKIYYNMWDTFEDFHNRVRYRGFTNGYFPMREYTKKEYILNFAPPIREVTEYSSTLKDLKEEYFMKIITGAWGINMFDEFVQKWQVNGGNQVLNAINAWYPSFR